MNERLKFVAACLTRQKTGETIEELCAQFGVSEKSGYKWMKRYKEGGVGALAERSRAPHSHAHAVPQPIVELLLVARRRHMRWGPRKLIALLSRQHPALHLPAASTVGELLKKHGLVGKPRRQRRSSPYGQVLRSYDAPNDVWCADFKGHFPVAGERCSPLTITDGFSRYILRCHALRHTLYASAREVFESAFAEYGLPSAIRTDNGPPFATLGPAGLSRLAIWWIHLGIRPERILPGRPDQHGRHERMHLTLKAACCRPPRSSFGAQQRAFDSFQREYNDERPHEALGQRTPSSFYKPSRRTLPRRLPELEYPSQYRLARAYPNGVISCAATQWYLSHNLANELVGLEQVNDGRWRVHFGPVVLGIIDLRFAKPRAGRRFATLLKDDADFTGLRRRRGRRTRR
jgi:putative transposase